MSDSLLNAADHVIHISQKGSVRSINASAAGAIALFEWQRQHYSQ
jgi:tRNA G18 (ribose-2'-O)-methylase SpoU